MRFLALLDVVFRFWLGPIDSVPAKAPRSGPLPGRGHVRVVAPRGSVRA
jgi:hypothetical protein